MLSPIENSDASIVSGCRQQVLFIYLFIWSFVSRASPSLSLDIGVTRKSWSWHLPVRPSWSVFSTWLFIRLNLLTCQVRPFKQFLDKTLADYFHYVIALLSRNYKLDLSDLARYLFQSAIVWNFPFSRPWLKNYLYFHFFKINII